MKEYFITSEKGHGEVVEKKSRFIAHVIPVNSEEEALEIIESLKKEYWDARHNCYAFVCGANNEVQRFSDDGEPQGTAGKPILEVLLNKNVHNTLILVTRYFGGTLLGTGGLIRAYGQAALEGLKDAKIEEVFEGVAFELSVDYESIGKIKYNMVQFGVGDAEEEYGEEVTLKIQMKKADFEKFKTSVIDATSGKAEFSDVEECEYREKAELDG
ncbi:MAG: YigZ family protein [Eubacterium sp.]|nr:YigZ family protein [Eubacterium sp.]